MNSRFTGIRYCKLLVNYQYHIAVIQALYVLVYTSLVLTCMIYNTCICLDNIRWLYDIHNFVHFYNIQYFYILVYNCIMYNLYLYFAWVISREILYHTSAKTISSSFIGEGFLKYTTNILFSFGEISWS